MTKSHALARLYTNNRDTTINFQEVDNNIKDLFVNSLLDLDLLFCILENTFDIKLFIRNSLIIFDEIQLFPKARQALKTLLKDGRYDYIETGSLAGITSNTISEEILIPSEEYTLEMHPLDFEEFLWATHNVNSMELIRDHFKKLKPLEQLHRKIFIEFRKYMCIGGMPKVVSDYAETKDFEQVNFNKEQILNLYRQDIKYQHATNSTNIDNILNSIPGQLSRHGLQDVKLFKFNQINNNARSREYNSPLRWLQEAMIINVARATTDPSAALTLTYTNRYFKCYLLDTGLLINLAFADGTYISNKFYGAILFDKLHINEGMFIENVIAQELVASKHKLIFYVKYNNSGRIFNEIDFIIRQNNKISPIEVRSGKKQGFKSLDKFKQSFTNSVGKKYILYEGDIKQKNDTIYLPYYMASLL